MKKCEKISFCLSLQSFSRAMGNSGIDGVVLVSFNLLSFVCL